MLNTYLKIDKWVYNNNGNVFWKSIPQRLRGYTERLVSTDKRANKFEDHKQEKGLYTRNVCFFS